MSDKEQENNSKHPLHKKVGCLLNKLKAGNIDVFLDEACGICNGKSKQQISLFTGIAKNSKDRLCKVDAMIAKDGFCKVVVEIEESGTFPPTQICGKYLTTALSTRYLKDSEKVELKKDGVFFLQIIDAKKLMDVKKDQLKSIAKFINDNKCGCVKRYELLLVENDADCDKIIDLITGNI
jgi:hypothetical protein